MVANMYYIPRKYVCKKCGFEMDYSPSNTYTFLPVDDEEPKCYKCLMDFINKNVPTMKLKD